MEGEELLFLDVFQTAFYNLLRFGILLSTLLCLSVHYPSCDAVLTIAVSQVHTLSSVFTILEKIKTLHIHKCGAD